MQRVLLHMQHNACDAHHPIHANKRTIASCIEMREHCNGGFSSTKNITENPHFQGQKHAMNSVRAEFAAR
ncbi:MAG TPA: hypothetical protein VHV08_08510 [Pirellulales bacterium]|jgi:hypothetical protein|nr:hypothetical protein [Pirellulales bacterium]